MKGKDVDGKVTVLTGKGPAGFGCRMEGRCVGLHCGLED